MAYALLRLKQTMPGSEEAPGTEIHRRRALRYNYLTAVFWTPVFHFGLLLLLGSLMLGPCKCVVLNWRSRSVLVLALELLWMQSFALSLITIELVYMEARRRLRRWGQLKPVFDGG